MAPGDPGSCCVGHNIHAWAGLPLYCRRYFSAKYFYSIDSCCQCSFVYLRSLGEFRVLAGRLYAGDWPSVMIGWRLAHFLAELACAVSSVHSLRRARFPSGGSRAGKDAPAGVVFAAAIGCSAPGFVLVWQNLPDQEHAPGMGCSGQVRLVGRCGYYFRACDVAYVSFPFEAGPARVNRRCSIRSTSFHHYR